MKLYKTLEDLKKVLMPYDVKNKCIGLVPTMGFLHKGHTSLIEKAAKENDMVVVSIFVNPTQFGPNEDYEKYPRDIKRDYELATQAGADIIFTPEVNQMYDHPKTTIQVKELTNKLCGLSRPGHFDGVTTVVAKLFNGVKPHKAYFGQKDAQQLIVIQKMVKDLNYDIEIIGCPIVRESDGLALSSRNVYLSTEERKQATILYKSLITIKDKIVNGERDAKSLKEEITRMIKSQPLAKIDYVALVDVYALENVEQIKDKVLIALAVKFGDTRLIDNIVVEV
ncbi:pantothenate synthetase [Natranaerovirga hydrolytica]|uniref:Pantothenate synthetase n=1 Tax=Natranaerovirga hydrolytica TaxID=680378 RepID=A0A4V2PZ09_9FIRM|nr:pantoate--beta-alanine ligase [Natranaerovirga hydrolytica]TCK88001.1 pantothenate synthetase [Natranaerovirga hydrolytica]